MPGLGQPSSARRQARQDAGPGGHAAEPDGGHHGTGRGRLNGRPKGAALFCCSVGTLRVARLALRRNAVCMRCVLDCTGLRTAVHLTHAHACMRIRCMHGGRQAGRHRSRNRSHTRAIKAGTSCMVGLGGVAMAAWRPCSCHNHPCMRTTRGGRAIRVSLTPHRLGVTWRCRPQAAAKAFKANYAAELQAQMNARLDAKERDRRERLGIPPPPYGQQQGPPSPGRGEGPPQGGPGQGAWGFAPADSCMPARRRRG